MKKNEPENFARISKIMLPKDYINYKLTGVHSCDYSDASGMLLLDVKNKKWSSEMLEICSVREDQMPKLFESYDVIGCLRPEIATALGKYETVLPPVIFHVFQHGVQRNVAEVHGGILFEQLIRLIHEKSSASCALQDLLHVFFCLTDMSSDEPGAVGFCSHLFPGPRWKGSSESPRTACAIPMMA